MKKMLSMKKCMILIFFTKMATFKCFYELFEIPLHALYTLIQYLSGFRM